MRSQEATREPFSEMFELDAKPRSAKPRSGERSVPTKTLLTMITSSPFQRERASFDRGQAAMAPPRTEKAAPIAMTGIAMGQALWQAQAASVKRSAVKITALRQLPDRHDTDRWKQIERRGLGHSR